MSRFHVMTGPPGAGKTAVLEVLRERIACIGEPARRVLAAQRETGGTATGDKDPAQFVAEMLALAIADHQSAEGLVLFDRGVPDLLAFCAYYGLPDAAVRRAARERRYANPVFWFPSWPDIYTKDAERRLDVDGAKAFGDLIKAAYLSCGYELVTVPQLSIGARANFVLDRMTR